MRDLFFFADKVESDGHHSAFLLDIYTTAFQMMEDVTDGVFRDIRYRTFQEQCSVHELDGDKMASLIKIQNKIPKYYTPHGS